ncbi:restriction endonuclease [Roseomonas sp. CCTCC AB2023176]|uniref:restriction endonuclease n=1 Tax=Roseomonas sp. CCTCC AB2023176 TaxID=3342640 RepID=UPI0035DC829F
MIGDDVELSASRYTPPALSPVEFELYVKDQLDLPGSTLEEYKSEHRTCLEADDGTYEIDILIRFNAFGADFVTLVECKRYRRPVGREKIAALHAKLVSLGAHKGIVFSTSGYQSGAVSYASKHGIALVEVADGRSTYLRKAALSDNDWSTYPLNIQRLANWLLVEKEDEGRPAVHFLQVEKVVVGDVSEQSVRSTEACPHPPLRL